MSIYNSYSLIQATYTLLIVCINSYALILTATVSMITMILFIDSLILSGCEDIVYVSKYYHWLSVVSLLMLQDFIISN